MTAFGSRAAAVNLPQQRPSDVRRLCCPNPECGRDDSLRVIEQAQLSTPATITVTAGITIPDITTEPDYEEEVNAAVRTLVGVRCAACQFSYLGPNPISKLRLPT